MLSDYHYNFAKYNAMDAATMMAIKKGFWAEIENDDNYRGTYNFTMKLAEPFMYMMKRGIRVDSANLSNMNKQIAIDLAVKYQELCTAMGREVPESFVNSSQQCQQYFYVELGIPPYYKDGKVTVDDKALTRIAKGTASRAPCKAARLVQEIRGLKKLISTYMEMDFDEDSRFRTDVKLRGTRFGRVSTGKTIRNTGMNMQNLPQRFKKYLIPDEGCFFAELDKRQAEWVVVAYLSKDPNMIKVHKEGLDPHIHTAHLMFGAEKELIKIDNEIVGHETDPQTIYELRRMESALARLPFLPRNMSMRQAGKKSNHGLNYDEGYKQFAMINEMTEKESAVIVAKYHNAYPGVRGTYHKMVQDELKQDRMLVNCFGRKNKFLGRWDDQLFKAGYAFKPQSTVVDLVNQGIIKTYYDESDMFKPLEMLAQVHDSVLEQYPLNELENFAHILNFQQEAFNPVMNYNAMDFQIATDLKIGFNWSDMEDCELTTDTNRQEELLKAKLDEFRQRIK